MAKIVHLLICGLSGGFNLGLRTVIVILVTKIILMPATDEGVLIYRLW